MKIKDTVCVMDNAKNLHKKITTLGLVLCMLLSLLSFTACFDGTTEEAKNETIAILYENDVHCAVEGYSKIAAMKKELAEGYDHVGVVSSGDFIQGGTLGSVSRGEYVVRLMNLVGYDAIALGNHEFDYRLPRLVELNTLSNTKFLCCNFVKNGESKPFFEPYTIVSYGTVKIAYVGITTPHTLKSSFPAQFKNENGEIIYTFNEAGLYELVQGYIDTVKREGADYVIALSHIGYSEAGSVADITDVIENTDGFDVVLDAHSHSVIEEMKVKDKSGDEVLLSSTGTKLEYVGRLTITKDGLDTELVKLEEYEKTDAVVDNYLKEVNEGYAALGNRKVGESLVTLNTHDGEKRIVRNSETALGNLTSDAFRVMTGADVAFVNGGGLRAPLEAGEVTFNDIYSVFPFNNQVVTVEVTGQILLDMLEMAVAGYPEERGCFPNMSGVTFHVNTAIPASVTVDESGFFTGIDGAYRVYGVKILDRETGTYKALDLEAKYVFAGFNYHLVDFGEGLSMFKNAKLIDSEGTLDIELLEGYITDHLGGVIGEAYAKPQGRIVFTDGYSDEAQSN